MAGETVIQIIGNLTNDPELKFIPSGKAVASFTVASTPRTFDRETNQWKDGDSLFMRCSVWGQYAENVAESLTRGMQVIVQGRLKQRSYDNKDGQKVTVTELDVEDVGPTLRFATAKVVKAQRGDSGGNGGGNSGSGNQGGGDWGSSQKAGVQRSGGQRPGPAQDDPWATGRGNYDAPPF